MAPIKEAVATYMMRASEKLRAQKSLCRKVRVCIRTGMFNPEEAKYTDGVVVEFSRSITLLKRFCLSFSLLKTINVLGWCINLRRP